MSGKKAKKKIPKTEKTVRKAVPVSLIKIKDVFKSNILDNIKDKHKKSLCDVVVLEIMMKCLKDIPEKEYIKKYLKNI